MKKLLSILSIIAMLMVSTSPVTWAQEVEANEEPEMVEEIDSTETAEVAEVEEEVVPEPEAPIKEEAQVETSLHKVIKKKFIEGGAGFMGSVLICLILGLALVFERVIYLFLSSTNTESLLAKIESALQAGGVEAAKEVCRNTRGPVASIFYEGLSRAADGEGLDAVEKAVVGYGGVQMGLLERNLSWIALFIAIAPMLGFMGTVIGMISAFDAIEIAGDVSPSLVAGGIKQALITTVTGLIVAIILQVFYNFLVAKIDGIVNKMEDASISLMDILVKHNVNKA